MKKIIGGIFVVLCIVGVLVLLFSHSKKPLLVKKAEFEEKDYTITGWVQNIENHTVLIKTEKGTIYSFSNLPSFDEAKLQLGDTIEIHYYGVLNTGTVVQTGVVNEWKNLGPKSDSYPESWDDHGIFQAYYLKAYQTLKTMSLEEKMGQLLLVRVPEDKQVDIASTYQFGGYILFGRDTKDKTADELKTEIKRYQAVSKIPMIIATDEEGGIVNRISTNPNLAITPFLSSQELYKKGGYELIKEDTKKKMALLFSLGINMNLAPVADVSTDEDDYIYERSFGQDANKTAKYIKTVVEASKNSSVASTLKHFPGYGNNQDTHTGLSIDNRDYDTFIDSDFLPFLTGIEAGVPAILVSHNIITNIEKDVPASLSRNIHNILREQLGFTGIIMTDDLAMDAILKYENRPAVKAILAGNDMIIISDYETGLADMKTAYQEGIITDDIIDHLVFRVLAFKYYMKLW